MAMLRVDFQEGFDHDDVVVGLDGGPRVRREQVTTRVEVGYAGSVALEAPAGPVQLHFEVATRGLAATTTIDVGGDVYVGVSISGGELQWAVSPEPLGYL